MFGRITRMKMDEMVENGNLFGAKPKLEETDTGTTTVEISMLDSFEDKITISQIISEPKSEIEIYVGPVAEQTRADLPTLGSPSPSPPSPNPPTCSPPILGSPTLGPPTRSPPTRSPPTHSPPTLGPPSLGPPALGPPAAPPMAPTTASPLEAKPQWSVGAQCQAVWSEDGKEYAATIQSIDGERCRVRFDGYGNEESMPLSTLKPVEPKGTQEWSAGSRCRARASDGLSYPAEVVWVQGQRCRVRFDHSNSEEELDVSVLLSTGELNGPSRTGRSATWRPSFAAGGRKRREVSEPTDKRETERDKAERGDRGARDRTWREPQQTSWQAKERVPGQIREEREPEDRRTPDRGTSHPSQPAPPLLPLPLPHFAGDAPAFVPPPPPFWAFGAQEPSAPLDPTSQMLRMWYMCGFHTGSYLAQQQQSKSSKD